MTSNEPAGWGIAPPDTTKAHFGARAIFNNHNVSLVPDRMGWGGKSGPEREALRTFMKTRGDALMRAMAARLSPSDAGVLEEVEDGFVVKVDPRGSCGYLYIGAWRA